jgi:hypothetical protein
MGEVAPELVDGLRGREVWIDARRLQDDAHPPLEGNIVAGGIEAEDFNFT